MNKFFSNRTFKIWEYHVSHGSLLVRSPKSSEFENNIDLVFVGVELLCLPKTIRNIEIIEEPEDQKNEKSYALMQKRIFRKFKIKSIEGEFSVVAVSVKFSENDGDIFDSPFKLFDE